MSCIRCGSDGHLEYGGDGQAYCGSCIFYGINKPCWKCRMYLPSAELQTFNGQLTCPYCIMDLKDEERRRNERIDSSIRSERTIGGERQEERCERCGRAMVVVYSFRGKLLCGTCVDEEKRDVGTQGGERPPMVVFRQKAEGPLSKIVSIFEKKIGEAIRQQRSEPKKEPGKTPLDRKPPATISKPQPATAPEPARPMSEERVKTEGVKYEIAQYKDLEFEGRSKPFRTQPSKSSKPPAKSREKPAHKPKERKKAAQKK